MGKTGIQFPSILLSSSIAFTKFSREVKCFTPSFIYTYAHPHASFSLGVLSTLPKITSFPFPPIPLALLYVAHLGGGGVCVCRIKSTYLYSGSNTPEGLMAIDVIFKMQFLHSN